MDIFWDAVSCSLVDIDRSLRGATVSTSETSASLQRITRRNIQKIFIFIAVTEGEPKISPRGLFSHKTVSEYAGSTLPFIQSRCLLGKELQVCQEAGNAVHVWLICALCQDTESLYHFSFLSSRSSRPTAAEGN